MVIKASGVPYDELTPDAIVVCDLHGGLVEGDLAALLRRRHARLRLPPASTDVGGIAHTHSSYATAWAARGEPIPCVLTAMADEFGGEIPIGPVRPDRRRGDRPRRRRDARRPPLAGRAAAQPRRVHPRPRPPRRDQDGGDVRGRRPHRASRAGARRSHTARPRGHRCALRPLPERLRTALRRCQRARASGCWASCRRSTTTCCRASPSARRRMRASSARRSPASPTSRSARPARDRDDIDRTVARLRAPGPRRAARGHAHLRARHARVARARRTRALPICLANVQPVPGVTAEWDMADLTYNQGIHGAQDTANAMVRAGRPFHVITDDWHADSFAEAVGELGAGGRRGLALARAEGRRLRLRDERDGRHPRRRPRAAARARAPGRRARARARCTARRRPSATTTCAR